MFAFVGGASAYRGCFRLKLTMPQQINLSTPAQAVSRERFTAQTMATALATLLVLGGILCAAWVWNLDRATRDYAEIATTQARETEGLKAALANNAAAAKPVDATLTQQVEAQRTALKQREQMKQALLDGRFQPGWGHSDRLQLVARSIPDAVWVTEVKADATRLEVTGFTLEPAALNQWVDRLAVSPLMQGLRLATVQVENTAKALVSAPGQTPAPATRPQWSFSLVSAQAVAPAPATVGGKP
jgi:Tfp pilus assembly protein PilN